jgi:imidazolonepropionase-like amidohydrolase
MMPAISLAIRNVTLINGTGADPLPGATVLVAGERIVVAGPGTRVDVPGGVETLDGTGRWLVPGLVDLHVHVNNCGEEAFPLWLANGVTSIRDIGGPHSSRGGPSWPRAGARGRACSPTGR